MIYFLQHIDIEGPGLLEDFFQEAGYTTHTVHLYAGDVLPQSREAQGVIILGGPMNVYEEEKHPFLLQEDTLIKKIIDKDIPTLGICLGSQLIAKAAGAQITQAPSEEIGFSKIEFTPEGIADPLFEGIDSGLNVFQWHQDTFSIPEDGILLAKSDICDQAFRLKKHIYALQFHIEITPKMIEDWIKEYIHRDQWNTRRCAGMIQNAYETENSYHMDAQRIFLNFARVINKKISV